MLAEVGFAPVLWDTRWRGSAGKAEQVLLASVRGVVGREGVTQEEMQELIQEECETAE